MIRPIKPPNASTSRTRWPLPGPPTEGLQGIKAIFVKLRVRRRVRNPSWLWRKPLHSRHVRPRQRSHHRLLPAAPLLFTLLPKGKTLCLISRQKTLFTLFPDTKPAKMRSLHLRRPSAGNLPRPPEAARKSTVNRSSLKPSRNPAVTLCKERAALSKASL